MFIYILCVIGHAVILLLSVYWLRVLTKPGLRRMVVFAPAGDAGSRNGFTFGTDMGRAVVPAAAPSAAAQQVAKKAR